MPTFRVELEGNHRVEVDVEAADEEEAREIATNLADDGEVEPYDQFFTVVSPPREI